jgi:hypothetical protein
MSQATPRAGRAPAALATSAALLLGGCGVGMGSAFVGQWSPRQEVEFEACLVDSRAPGDARAERGCKERKEVEVDVPGRRFWGVILPVLPLGASQVSYGGEEETQLRFQPSIEVLRGSGRWAYGVRTGLILDSSLETVEGPDGEPMGDPDATMVAWDVTALGHVSLLDRLNAYGGLGYVPYASARGHTTSVGGRAVLGAQLALTRTHSTNYIVLTMELDRVQLRLDETYRSTSLTGYLGIFF